MYRHTLVVLACADMGNVMYMRKKLIEEEDGVNHHTVATDHLAALQYGGILIFQRPFKLQQRSTERQIPYYHQQKGIIMFVVQIVHLLLIDFPIVVLVSVDLALKYHGGLAIPLELPAVAEFANRVVQEVVGVVRASRLLREIKWMTKVAIAKKTNFVQLFRVLL